MTVCSRDKTRVINVSVSRRNEEVLDLVEDAVSRYVDNLKRKRYQV